MLERKHKICLALLVVIVVTALLYFVPKASRFDHTLHAVILDSEGNQIGTTEISMKGAKLEYLFKDTLLNVEILPFDRYSRFNLTENAENGDEGTIFSAFEVQFIFCSAWDTTVNDTVFARLFFSPEMDRWMFVNESEKRYYLASVNDAYTIEELTEYFQLFINS